MKSRHLFILAALLLTACGGSKTTASQSRTPSSANTTTEALITYQDAITPAFLKAHLSVLADDSMRGRETGMPGQKKAAHYLARQYRQLGLQPVGDNQSYFQKFELTATQADSVVYTIYSLHKNGDKKIIEKSTSSKSSSASFIRKFGGDKPAEGNIIFAGYGIQNQKLGIDQLKTDSLKGKWVMVFGGALSGDIPQVVGGDTLYTNRRSFAQSWFQNIAGKGVAGILVIPDEKKFEDAAQGNRSTFEKPMNMQLKYRAGKQQNASSFSYDLIKPEFAAKILNQSEGKNLDSLRNRIIHTMKTFSPEETSFGLKQIPYSHDVGLESENVAAFLKGGDPSLNNQVVVLSAHYDHLGVGQPDSTGDRIYNGANDDGSGTIGVLGAARAFAKAKEHGVKPKRSILFLSVAGEEKGLLGSRYYSDHPIYPVKQTAADINTDMIGRVDHKHQRKNDANYIYVIGAGIISSDIDSLMKTGNNRAGQLELDMRYNDLNDPNQFYRRSDHWNFGRLGIPFVFFFNGVHEDYHRQSDEVDKINFDLMAKTARSMFATTVMVANADSMPAVDNQEFIEATQENN